MSGWSIHNENGKYVVKMMARSTEQVDAGKNEEGEKVGTYSTWLEAAAKIVELEAEEKKEIRHA